MSGAPEPPDPLAELAGWAKQAERRARRSHRLAGLGRVPGRVARGLARGLASGRRSLLILVVLAVLVGGAWYVSGHLPALGGRNGGEAARAYPTVSQPSGSFATSGVGARQPTGPFEHTPAAQYPEGEAGFVLPPATGLAGWTPQQATAVLSNVRQALIALYLDHRSLVSHDPGGLLPLLAPNARDNLRKQYTNPADGSIAVLIAPGARLSREAPRVSGRTTVGVAQDEHGRPVLEITTNYVLVYPFDSQDFGWGSRLVVYHGLLTWHRYPDNAVSAADQGLWVTTAQSYRTNVDCPQSHKGLVAPGIPQAAASPQASHDAPDAYFDPNHTLDIPDDCP